MGKYETHVEPNLDLIGNMIKNGSTEKRCAETLGVGISTFREYKKKYPALLAVVNGSKQTVVKDVRAALIKKAKGFDYVETKKTYLKLDIPEAAIIALRRIGYSEEDIGVIMTIKEEVANKKALPDTSAINMVLKNYDKHEWSDNPQMLDIKKKELKLKEKALESNLW